MPIRPLRLFPLLPAMLLTLACGGGNSRSMSSDAVLQVVGKFEKRTLTPTGLSAVTLFPTRNCYAEIRRDSDDTLLVDGYLGEDGTGSAKVPAGAKVYVKLYPLFQVPGTKTFFMEGGVKNAAAASTYPDLASFNALPDWSVSSASLNVGEGGTITVQALNSTPNREAGAFNIADQAIAFAQTIQALEPTLTLPNLHLFWQSGGQATTGFPSAAVTTAGKILQQSSNRAVFQMTVRGRVVSSLEAGVDEFNDGVLQQRFASLLFTPFSYPGDGSAPTSIIRSDNDPFGRTDRGIQGESTAAFITGFSDFLSGAVRNSPTIIDVDAKGALNTFHLDNHTHTGRVAQQGEFYSDAVTNSLYGIWKNAYGGSLGGLQTLWQATLATTPGAYLNAPLGCYPTYLAGLKQAVSAATWTTVLHELALEDVPDVTAPSYFGDPATVGTQPLWLTVGKPFTGSGSLVTYPSADNIYYDRNQAEAFRFLQVASGPFTATMTPLDGQDFFLELIGPTGLLLESYTPSATAPVRTLTSASLAGGVLPAGTYVIRVKAGYTSAAMSAARYTLAIN